MGGLGGVCSKRAPPKRGQIRKIPVESAPGPLGVYPQGPLFVKFRALSPRIRLLQSAEGLNLRILLQAECPF